ncbi:MAG: hypothetical protein MZV65_33875 [Chromatiales bacterium]|nr:hypothetical protein [Chromatiales bacterium]
MGLWPAPFARRDARRRSSELRAARSTVTARSDAMTPCNRIDTTTTSLPRPAPEIFLARRRLRDPAGRTCSCPTTRTRRHVLRCRCWRWPGPRG